MWSRTVQMNWTEGQCFTWLPICVVSLHEMNPLFTKAFVLGKQMHGNAHAFHCRVVFATHISWCSDNAIFSNGLFLPLSFVCPPYLTYFTRISTGFTQWKQPVTSQGRSGRARMAVNLKLNQPNLTSHYNPLRKLQSKENSLLFSYKLWTLFLREKLRYKNFVSVTL